MGVTSQLAKFVAEARIDAMPCHVAQRARSLLLDLIGNIVRARHECESTPALIAAVGELGWGHGQSRVFGDSLGYSPASAAFLNGALAHSLDFDDTHTAAALHPGCTVIPAALAAADIGRANDADLLAGITAGYEVACRLALALPALAHFSRGFQPTTTCGVFGAAAAAARVFGLDAAGVEASLGIALSQSSGSPQYSFNGAWTKRFQVGWASSGGLTAAILAKNGFRAPVEALEGKYGFLRREPTSDETRVVRDLGSQFELLEVGLKPYPSCRFGHAGIDAAVELHRTKLIDPSHIKHVIFGTSAFGLETVGEPIDQRRNPQTVVDGQFSAPFVLAVALVTGNMRWDDYALLHEPAIKTLMDKIDCVINERIEAVYPNSMGGTLTVVSDSNTWRREVLIPKGEPSKFLTTREILEKFLSLSATLLGRKQAERMANWALSIGKIEHDEFYNKSAEGDCDDIGLPKWKLPA